MEAGADVEVGDLIQAVDGAAVASLSPAHFDAVLTGTVAASPFVC